MHSVLRTVEEYGRLDQTIPADMLALHGLLLTLLNMPSAVEGTVGLLMRLRDSCQEGARGQVLQTILIQTLQELSVIAECAPFGDLMIRAETMAKEKHQWTDDFGYQKGISFKRLPATFQEMQIHPDARMTCLPAREDMLDILAEHTKFGSGQMWRHLLTPAVAVTTSGKSP